MSKLHNANLVPYAKKLRKNQTKEERRLWYDFLSGLPIRFTRQKVIDKYIVDFCCTKIKLIIELDGSQHFEETGVVQDKIRDEYLQSLGYRVLRYSNLQIHRNFKEVCEDIYRYLNL